MPSPLNHPKKYPVKLLPALLFLQFLIITKIQAQDTLPPPATVATTTTTQPPTAFTPQTQISNNASFNVTLQGARIQNGVLTVIALYENTSSTKQLINYPVDDVYYVDNAQKKKYKVLKDEKNSWIAAPVCDGVIGLPNACYKGGIEVNPTAKQAVWFKFPAPAESPASLQLVIPDTLPFDNVIPDIK